LFLAATAQQQAGGKEIGKAICHGVGRRRGAKKVICSPCTGPADQLL
jgi:hypothetical protein